MFVEIAVIIPSVLGVFDYHIPEHLHGKVLPGSLVTVPFGKQTLQGVVLREVQQPQVPRTRPVLSLLDPQPVVSQHQVALARQLAEETLSPLAACLGLMIPPGLRQQADTLYQLTEKYISTQAPDLESEGFSAAQKRLLERLNRPANRESGLRGRQLDAIFRHHDWKRTANALERRGWVTSSPVLPQPTVRPRKVRTAQLACSPADALAGLDTLGRGKALERRQTILRYLLSEPWSVDVSALYAASGGNLNDLKYLAGKGLVTLSENEVWRDPLENIPWVPPRIPSLTHEQQAAWDQIRPHLQTTNSQLPFILHGVTGSGKTEIYLRAVEDILQQGRQALVMVPEISLTPQTVRRFMSRFPGQVGLVHSRLSAGERYDTWRRTRAGLLPVIVGPRSALFSPLSNLGLIIVDECHDDSYFQTESIPFYSAINAAISYGKLTGSTVVLGSATPPITLLQQAQHENWPVLHLPDRILAHRQAVETQMAQIGRPIQISAGEGESTTLPLPPVKIVDMRLELKAGNRSIFSRILQKSLDEVLNADQQAILFLNRRGRATYVFCRDCGYSLRCPRCDLPLTYHTFSRQADALICHTCGYRRKMPHRCPQCGSTRIRQFGTGTEKVESELLKIFPQARTLRWDASTTQGKDAHEFILSQFSSHRADILIGTQMLAKGLDLPLVTLVGVILAEVGLNLPDYRAGERTFQLLTQVAGRAGRSPLGGRVILQTFQPEHYAIRAASGHNFSSFYSQELAYRKKIDYPPFSRLVRMEFRHLDAEQAESTARRMGEKVSRWLDEGGFNATEMIGPVPCFFSRQRGYYRWQIILRGPNPADALRDRPLGEWRIEVDPPSLL